MIRFLFCVILICIWTDWINIAEAAVPIDVQPREFIIDTDVGIDDAIAILYLLNQPNVVVKAITIESDGNAHCKPAYANIKKILQLTHHINIPVACGRSKPLQGSHIFPARIMAICDTLAGTQTLDPTITIPTETAENLLTKTLDYSNHPMDILAIGPMTTIASILEQRPDLKNKIHMIYEMGGAIRVPGNIVDVDHLSKNYVAEWNIYIDPYAADQVFHDQVPITLIPLDVTNHIPLDHAFYERFKHHHATPVSNFVYALLNHNTEMINAKVWYFWDPLAAVIAKDTSLATVRSLPLSVKLSPESSSGETYIDKKNGGSVHVCTAINSEKFKNILLSGLN